MLEAEVRDLLSRNLEAVGEGLTLLKIEQYIPATICTRSFLDILAKDSSGHWVIIEVKKAEASSREAIHEVIKYTEAVKEHFAARDDEIRVIIASTEWRELLVPFSRFQSETSISVEGVELTVDLACGQINGQPVTPAPITQGRMLAPWHELNLYKNKTNLLRGIGSYQGYCSAKGIDDYVLVVLKAADDFNERAQEQLDHALSQIVSISDPGVEIKFASANLDKYEYILYFAPRLLTREHCYSIIATNTELFEEVKSYVEDMDPDEELAALHQNVYDLEPRQYKDWFEIGYAAKFKTRLLGDEGWTVEEVLRYGAFARNSLLTDEAIIEELGGATGSSGQSFRRTITMRNPAHVSTARTDLKSALSHNPAWLAQINRVLDDIMTDCPDAEVTINVHNPSTGVFTIYFIMNDEESMDHYPLYQVQVSVGNVLKRLYAGMLAPDGEPCSLADILDDFYDGEIGKLMMTGVWGFYEQRDTEILERLGLAYRTYRIDDPEGKMSWFELRNDRWRAFQVKTPPFQPLQEYFDNNADLLADISSEIGPRMHGGLVDMS